MEIIKGISNFSSLKYKKPVVAAIGTFDGVHIAHKKIIKRAVSTARRLKGVSIVLTFYPHPMRITNPGKTPALLTSIEHRVGLIAVLNPDICLIADFGKSFAGMSPQDFIKDVLLKCLRAEYVVIGKNFKFGKNKSGNIELLKKSAAKSGFKVDVLEPVKKSGRIISSSVIRELIEKGRLYEGSRLLGRRFSVLGTVIKGDSRGRVLGYPTANIDPHQEALPPNGVYAVRAKIENKWYGGMLNIGRRPTFYPDAHKLVIEANIFNFNKYLYGQILELFFVKKLRNEKRFTSADLLKKQLKNDELRAKAILRPYSDIA